MVDFLVESEYRKIKRRRAFKLSRRRQLITSPLALATELRRETRFSQPYAVHLRELIIR
jgi:hypothetical protein